VADLKRFGKILMFTFSSKGEAAFVQSLLESHGVRAEVLDGSGDIGGPASARLVVAADDIAEARRLIEEFRRDSTVPGTSTSEFPFAAIVWWTTLIFGVLGFIAAVASVVDQPPSERLSSSAVLTFVTILVPILVAGVIVGFGLATAVAVIRAVWRKWRLGFKA
jgi:hypothetical protein